MGEVAQRRIAKLSILIAGLLVSLGSTSQAAPVCPFGGVRCFVACGNPPKTTDDAVQHLKKDRYAPITGFDRWTALFTTPLGKCLGINGWKRYRFHVSAAGKVVQAVTSWDGLRTIDLELDEFNGKPPECKCKGCYIRSEIVRHVWKRLDHPPVVGERIRIAGELHWDGHGFLEIHPERKEDVE